MTEADTIKLAFDLAKRDDPAWDHLRRLPPWYLCVIAERAHQVASGTIASDAQRHGPDCTAEWPFLYRIADRLDSAATPTIPQGRETTQEIPAPRDLPPPAVYGLSNWLNSRKL
jgi:hypothetical protein